MWLYKLEILKYNLLLCVILLQFMECSFSHINSNSRFSETKMQYVTDYDGLHTFFILAMDNFIEIYDLDNMLVLHSDLFMAPGNINRLCKTFFEKLNMLPLDMDNICLLSYFAWNYFLYIIHAFLYNYSVDV